MTIPPKRDLVGVARDAVDEAQLRVVRLASLRHDRLIPAAQVHVVEVEMFPFLVGRLGGHSPDIGTVGSDRSEGEDFRTLGREP